MIDRALIKSQHQKFRKQVSLFRSDIIRQLQLSAECLDGGDEITVRLTYNVLTAELMVSSDGLLRENKEPKFSYPVLASKFYLTHGHTNHNNLLYAADQLVQQLEGYFTL